MYKFHNSETRGLRIFFIRYQIMENRIRDDFVISSFSKIPIVYAEKNTISDQFLKITQTLFGLQFYRICKFCTSSKFKVYEEFRVYRSAKNRSRKPLYLTLTTNDGKLNSPNL